MVDAYVTTLIIALSTTIYALAPPLMDGVERKIRAKIQSRMGPPTVLQTWYDIFKLLLKEAVLPTEASPTPYIVALLLALVITAVYMVSYLVTCSIYNPIHIAILLVLLVSIHNLSVVLYTLYSNPFSIIGTSRILLLDVLNEVAFIAFFALSVTVISIRVKSLFIPLLIVLILALTVLSYVLSRRLPYDLHEAEPELASGSLIEFSGPILAIYLYSSIVKRYLYTSLPIAIVLLLTSSGILDVVVLHAATTAVYLVHGIVNTMLARSRIDIAIKTLTYVYLAMLVASLIIILVHYT